MFLIANAKEHDIPLPDLKWVIKKHQAIDLHCLSFPVKPEDSVDLKNRIKDGSIKVLRQERPPVVVSDANPAPPTDTKEIVSIIREEIRKIQQPQDHTEDLSEAIKNLNSIMAKFLTGEVKTTGENISIPAKKDDYEVKDIDQNILSKIHAKAVDKLVKNVDGSIHCDEKNIESGDLLNNISELEDLA